MESGHWVLRFKGMAAGVLGLLTALWGWFGWLTVAWISLMAVDWIVGSAVAAKDGRWNSAKAREGAWHKGGMMIVVCVALAADWLIGTLLGNLPLVELPFTYSVLLGPLVMVWYVVGELGSLAEHAAAMGAPVPPWLLRFLLVSREAIESAGEAITGEEPGEAHKIEGGTHK